MKITEHVRSLVKLFLQEIEFYRRVIKHPRTPLLSKILLTAAVAYAISPIDLIPDFIPVLGYLDDLIILPLLIWIAVKMIPNDIIIECRKSAKEDTK